MEIMAETEVPLYYAVYNPNLIRVNLINFQREIPHLSISVWSVFEKAFVPVYAEAFCYASPEHKKLKECDIYVNQTIEALSLTILRIERNESMDISIKSNFTNWISNA